MTGYASKKAAANAKLEQAKEILLQHPQKDIDWQREQQIKAHAKLGAAPDNIYTIKLPERSEWKCYMFGNTPRDNQGIVWVPIKGQEPNWFVRWMMKVCFACTWIKEKNSLQ